MVFQAREYTAKPRRKLFRHSGLRSALSAAALRPRHVASNFAILGVAEVLTRAISIVVTLSLTKRLGDAGYGRVEFAFNVVFWLVLIVRDCFETIATRELARHPRLTKSLVNHVIAVKLTFALVLYLGLSIVGAYTLSEHTDVWILRSYGLLLLTTALGIDFVFKGSERMGLVAISLCIRTLVYSAGVWLFVHDAARIVWVPLCLALGEAIGIGLVWLVYSRLHGLPRPTLNLRFLVVFVRRGRSVCLVHLTQAVIISTDLMVVGLTSRWGEVGQYGAPHRMISAVMAFGLIFQQVVFPSLSRSWRGSSTAGRDLLDLSVRALVSGFLPIAVGGMLLAEPLVRFLFPPEYRHSGLLLALGIWRTPLLSLAFLYQSSLIAMNRESAGLRLLVGGALGAAPLVAFLRWQFDLPGASVAVLFLGMVLVIAGYFCLLKEGRQPAAHHHIARPLVASVLMVPVCIVAARFHVTLAVLSGAIVYLSALKIMGGLHFPLDLTSGLQNAEPALRGDTRLAHRDGRSPQGSNCSTL
jgi:O-antigen/teichoic acid export membrane protein